MLAVGVVPSAAQETVVPRKLIGTTTLQVNQFTPSWQPIPSYSYIRTWFDGTGYQVAMSDAQPWNTVGWLESPTFTVPRATNTQEGNDSIMTVKFSFTPNYTGSAPEMRVRFHTSDFVEYAAASVTPSRFAALRAQGQGELRVILDRRNFTADRLMRMYVDMISVTTEGNADPNFHFRINEVVVRHYEPSTTSVDASRVTSSYLEIDGDLAVYVNGSTSRRRISDDVDGYAASGSYVIAVRDGDLYAFDGPNDFNRITIEDNGTVVSAAVSGEHVMWVENDDEWRYFNILTRASFRVERDKDFIGVVPQATGSFVAVAYDSDADGERRFYVYDASASAPSVRRLDDDSGGRFVNVGSTGVVYNKSNKNATADAEILSGWFVTD